MVKSKMPFVDEWDEIGELPDVVRRKAVAAGVYGLWPVRKIVLLFVFVVQSEAIDANSPLSSVSLEARSKVMTSFIKSF